MTQTEIPEDSKSPQVYLGAAVIPNDKYSSYEEEDDESLYMENQV